MHDDEEQRPADDFVLGGAGRFSYEVFIPTESGFLIGIEVDHKSNNTFVRLMARTCIEFFDQWEPMWLPYSLGMVNGRLIWDRYSDWRNCEEWWIVEHIDRLSRLPYDEPPGPLCELMRLNEIKGWCDDTGMALSAVGGGRS